MAALTYSVATTPTLRWAGIAGQFATVAISAGPAPVVTITGERRGEITFPIDAIDRLRASPEFGRTTHHHCYIWRRGHRTINIGGHRELVLHLATEMTAIGNADRIERGLPGWAVAVHLALWIGLGALLAYVPFGTWHIAVTPWDANDFAIAGMSLACGAGSMAWGVWSWLRWYRPRRVRDLHDLEDALQAEQGLLRPTPPR